MSFRIIIEREKTAILVRVHGRLAGEGAAEELVHACQPTNAPLVVDLSDLRFADDAALSALRSLRAQGVALLGVSPYISLLMGK